MALASTPSVPWMAANTIAASAALRQMGPTLSRLQLKVIPPLLLMLPNVGRKPLSPQVDAGEMIEPQVSVPIAKGTKPAAVAEAEPAEDPEEPVAGFQGLRVRPPYQ